MFDLWSPEHSVLREKVLERVFLTEISKVLLIEFGVPFEILRSEYDANGYDVVIEAHGIIRHVQLKATRIGGKRASVDINLALAEKPSGCVIWFMADPATLRVGPFYWLGGEPGEPLPAPQGSITRHSRGNAAGIKGKRKGLRRVSKGQFVEMETAQQLARALFGVDLDHTRLLQAHLDEREVDMSCVSLAGDLRFESSDELASLIDGYSLAEAARLGAPEGYLIAARSAAITAGSWPGSTLELWVTLFLEHRHYRFSSFLPGIADSMVPQELLDRLSAQLVARLQKHR